MQGMRKRSTKAELGHIENKVCELYNSGYSVESIALLLSKRTHEVKLHLFNAINDNKIVKRETTKWIIKGSEIAKLLPIENIAEYYKVSNGEDGNITFRQKSLNNR